MKNGYYKDEYGTQQWYLNGKLHREDGPAYIEPDGYQAWWVNHKDVTYEVSDWFKEYNLTYETMDEEERMMLKFNMVLFSKKK